MSVCALVRQRPQPIRAVNVLFGKRLKNSNQHNFNLNIDSNHKDDNDGRNSGGVDGGSSNNNKHQQSSL